MGCRGSLNVCAAESTHISTRPLPRGMEPAGKWGPGLRSLHLHTLQQSDKMSYTCDFALPFPGGTKKYSFQSERAEYI